MKDLAAELTAAKDVATKEDSRPLADQLAGCRAYIDRAQASLQKTEEALMGATQTRGALSADLKKHKDKPAQLEREVAGTAIVFVQVSDPSLSKEIEQFRSQMR